MISKKLAVSVGAISIIGFAAPAFAADAVKISCPGGTVQQLIAQQDVACVKSDGSRAAGPMVMLYPSGKKMAQGQVDAQGFRTGNWILYSEVGVKTHTIQFARGNFDGRWVELHPNGQPKKVEMYAKGLKVGEAQQFDLAGKLLVAR